jgi:hypothetical protein
MKKPELSKIPAFSDKYSKIRILQRRLGRAYLFTKFIMNFALRVARPCKSAVMADL